MKLLKLSISIFILAVFFSCNGLKRDRHDIVTGTPTNADTILFSASHSSKESGVKTQAKDSLPIVFWR